MNITLMQIAIAQFQPEAQSKEPCQTFEALFPLTLRIEKQVWLVETPIAKRLLKIGETTVKNLANYNRLRVESIQNSLTASSGPRIVLVCVQKDCPYDLGT